MTELTTTAAVIDELGGIAEVAKLTGRKYNAVSNWRVLGSFPSNTYLILNGELCERGHSAPLHLFRMVQEAAQ